MPDESLTEIAESVGLEIDDNLKADFWPETGGQIARFVDHKTNSRIRILTEKTE